MYVISSTNIKSKFLIKIVYMIILNADKNHQSSGIMNDGVNDGNCFHVSNAARESLVKVFLYFLLQRIEITISHNVELKSRLCFVN